VICGSLAVRDDLISLSQLERGRILVITYAHDESPRTFLCPRHGYARL
jgi:hypothetical protein